MPEDRLQWIVTLGPGANPAIDGPLIAQQHGGRVGHVYTSALRGFSFSGSAQAAERLSRDPRVRTVVADQPVAAAAQVAPTGIERIEAGGSGGASSAGIADADSDIAILDTGVDVDHPDLNVAGGKNCTGETNYDDGNGHGTHVAGTAAAKDDSNGVVGVAPGARVWAVKVLDANGSGTWSSVICGIDWVTANASTIEVANLSLGGPGNKGTCTDGGLNEAICRSTGAGVTYTVAAGNSAVDAAGFVPASYDEVIAVSALADFDGKAGGLGASTCRSDVDDSFADFSNYGPVVDFIAPGVCIHSTYKGDAYATMSGTSMAAPHVAGAAARYLAVNPAADWRQVQAKLTEVSNPTWNASDDPDGIKEPLLNVAALGTSPSAFVPLPAPQRLFDTRAAADGGYLQPGQTITRPVTGQAGVPSTGVTAVVLNVTGVETGGGGFVTVWPSGAPRPNASSLNFTAPDQVRPNLVIVPVGADGSVSFYSQSGGHLLADVAGYFRPTPTSASGRLSSLAPQRILDTREAIGAPPAKPGPGSVVTLQATGRGGVPTSGVAAVVLNVTATDATGPGYVTVWPNGQPQPLASNLNLEAAQDTNANLVIVPVGPDGQVNLFSQSGTHLVADVFGWFSDTTRPDSASGLFVTLDPRRVFDTRLDSFVSAGSTITRTHAGVAGIPTTGVSAVSVNLTGTAAAGPGHVTAWPEGSAPPNASTLNLGGPNDTRPNAAILPLGGSGAISFYSASGSHLLVDTTGYFTA